MPRLEPPGWQFCLIAGVLLCAGCGNSGESPAATATRTPTATVTSTPPPTATPTVGCETPGVICTVAGTGMSVFDGDGRPALQTSFYFPLGVCFDRSDQPLIVDWNNLRIRRLNEDGTISTIMGKDYEDFPTDGALAIDTPLHHASDIAFDNAGNLYVAGNHVPVVFRVGTDNRVHTVAGTMDVGYDGDGEPALQATLNTPFAVLPTNDGGFYVSDAEAHVLRYVDSAGIIRTVAGTGAAGYSGDGGPAVAARLNGPTHMRLDAQGNLYFSDTDNHVIRRVDTGGTITTVAGTGEPGYTGDGGPAEQAQFNTPFDVRFAPDGTLYVADTGNNAIRRIDAHGIVTTVVGTGTRGFAGDGGDARVADLNRPSGITFAADGALWIADTYNQRVRRVATFLR